MFEHPLDELHSIVYVRPRSKLEQADFEQLAATVDPHIEETHQRFSFSIDLGCRAFAQCQGTRLVAILLR